MKFVMCCIVLSLLVGVVVFVIFVLGMLFVYVSKDKFEIGFCIDDLCVECWLCDCDYFVVVVMKFGVKVFVQFVDVSEVWQILQIENLILCGVDVIVIVLFNLKMFGNVVVEVWKVGIKVVLYDCLIFDVDVDVYILFDNEKVGELQVQGVFDVKLKGNYFLLGGVLIDNNVKMLCEG